MNKFKIASYIIVLVINTIVLSSVHELVVNYDINFRKVFILFFSVAFINILLYIGLRSLNIAKILFIVISIFPFWIRGAYYINFGTLPNDFYFISLDIFIFFVLSTLMFLSSFKNIRKLYTDKNILYIFSIFIVVHIGIIINFFTTDKDLTEINIYLVNILLPMLFIISLYMYYFTTSSDNRILILKSIRNFYYVVLIFILIEFLFKGGVILKNPMLLLEHGLRLSPSLNDSSGYGASIISGGIRDMLYLAFLFSIYPIVGDFFLQKKLITNRAYKLMLGFSFIIVIGIYSKTPIVLFLVSLLLTFNLLSLKRIVIFIISICLLLLIVSDKILLRLEAFSKAIGYLLDGSFGMAREAESSAIGRLLNILDRYKEIELSPYFGQSSFYLVDSSIIYFSSIIGIIFYLCSILFSIFIFNNLNKLGRKLFLVVTLYTIFTFHNFIGIGGTNTYLSFDKYSLFIQIYGWFPNYSTANIYVSSLLIFLFLINKRTKNEKRAD